MHGQGNGLRVDNRKVLSIINVQIGPVWSVLSNQ